MDGTSLVATCLFGLEKLLGEEIDALGCERVYTMDGRVRFRGNAADAARANVFLRTAERVFLLCGEEFDAPDFDSLFEGARAIPWEDYIPADGVFPVTGHSIKSRLTSIPACQKILKKALSVRLGSAYGLQTLPETGSLYPVEFFLFKDRCALMIDTSGTALHKRGYRPAANAAPLRETLAAALCMTARTGEHEDILLWDPFCGSGTIPIEAAMIASKTAPGAARSFAGEQQITTPEKFWREAREEAAALRRQTSFRAVGTDIDPRCIETAKANALRAGIGNMIEFRTSDVRDIKRPEGVRGTFICNPPYGERMMTRADAEQLYRDMKTAFAPFDRWAVYVLTSCEYFERLFGRKADRRRKLYNGTIPCTYYQFFKPVDAAK